MTVFLKLYKAQSYEIFIKIEKTCAIRCLIRQFYFEITQSWL